MVRRTSTWSLGPRPSPTRHSRRHSLRRTQMTPLRSLWHSTIHEAPTLATSLVSRFPPMAGLPSPGSPTPAATAPSPTPLATQLFCTTAQAGRGSQFGWTATRVVHWAVTSPLILRIQIAGLIFAFTPAAPTTEIGRASCRERVKVGEVAVAVDVNVG